MHNMGIPSLDIRYTYAAVSSEDPSLYIEHGNLRVPGDAVAFSVLL
jgi:hypothetical protein